jgi:hypothetical protein
VIPAPSFAMARLFDLDFSPGLEIQRLAKDHFPSPVSFRPSKSSEEFFLVASFGRSTIRLIVDFISRILQSCLGGNAKDFNALHLSGICFHFSLISKPVGFLVYNLKFFECSKFAVFFDLWGNGGPIYTIRSEDN